MSVIHGSIGAAIRRQNITPFLGFGDRAEEAPPDTFQGQSSTPAGPGRFPAEAMVENGASGSGGPIQQLRFKGEGNMGRRLLGIALVGAFMLALLAHGAIAAPA